MVGVVFYLLTQVSQLGKQAVPPPTAVLSAAGVAPQVVAPPPALPAGSANAPRGQGAIRMSSRLLEPTYSVAPGDTLGSIAARFGTSVEALEGLNNLTDRNALSVGQRLVVPGRN